MKNTLELQDFNIQSIVDNQTQFLLNSTNLKVAEGEKIIVIGESGSGKTMLTLALVNLLPNNCFTSGKIFFDEKEITVNKIDAIRGKEIVLIPQGSKDHLNPNKKLKSVLKEQIKLLKLHNVHQEKLLQRVNLNLDILNYYPHEISGGEGSRFMMALALLTNPKLIILDEPTYGLDKANKDLFMKTYFANFDLSSSLFISHDLTLLPYFDRVLVIKDGKVIEDKKVKDFLLKQDDPYSSSLMHTFNEERAC